MRPITCLRTLRPTTAPAGERAHIFSAATSLLFAIWARLGRSYHAGYPPHKALNVYASFPVWGGYIYTVCAIGAACCKDVRGLFVMIMDGGARRLCACAPPSYARPNIKNLCIPCRTLALNTQAACPIRLRISLPKNGQTPLT